MATTAANIRAALASALEDLGECSGYLLSQPSPPAFEIEPAGVEYDQAYNRGLHEWTFTVRGFVATATDIEAQKNLDVWLAATGTGSVKAAIETDLTLGGVVETLHVTSVSPPKTYSVASMPNALYLGAEWTVRILAGP